MKEEKNDAPLDQKKLEDVSGGELMNASGKFIPSYASTKGICPSCAKYRVCPCDASTILAVLNRRQTCDDYVAKK